MSGFGGEGSTAQTPSETGTNPDFSVRDADSVASGSSAPGFVMRPGMGGDDVGQRLSSLSLRDVEKTDLSSPQSQNGDDDDGMITVKADRLSWKRARRRESVIISGTVPGKKGDKQLPEPQGECGYSDCGCTGYAWRRPGAAAAARGGPDLCPTLFSNQTRGTGALLQQHSPAPLSLGARNRATS
ncbi:hypothetical protein JL722_5114 [Aureococcus anophagefferens]|nr:hypothetical protein JL722_5114 [Aureococcus anophagefferens]